ncbi:extracellular solute-binding protein [Actinocrinis puniceicyclus]|uniref:Extracellular solute-binding protein n=1 Tax=Actinocrinis puniceicyclus TaxID=977794 RepID=A0A8J7WJW8_9ACTN|nr:extracellular solute-binding protein [Actinocrinis puniceicyclus]MBS2961497.1 extracellular solute-binding protein [Actinocrinis puniceicyclus]
MRAVIRIRKQHIERHHTAHSTRHRSTEQHRPAGRATLSILLAALGLVAAACGSNTATNASATTGSATAESPARTGAALSLTLYTSVTQNTVDSVVAGFKAAHPGSNVTVFRATTGALNARLAADQRTGGVRADVVWGTDPLSMQSYAAQQLLRSHPIALPPNVPAKYATDALYPTRLLYLVIVARKGLTALPTTWSDLASPAYRGKVAIPDPAAAGSALAALGYFAQAPGYGMDFYRRLKANGAVQVATIPEVVTDVAQGRYALGISLDSQVRSAQSAGSPVQIVWPKPGAITLYSPIAVTSASKNADAAGAFLRYVLSTDAQRRIAATGWQPVLPGIPGPPIPAGAGQVTANWPNLFGHQHDLLGEYQSIFGL